MKTIVNNESHTIWNFTRAELVALLAHMSTDATRETQYGLVLDVTRGRAHATDGHRAVLVTTGDRVDQDRGITGVHLVPRELLEKAVKIAKAGSLMLVCCADGRVKISVDSTTLDGLLSDAIPNRIDAVLLTVGSPSTHKGVAQGFNGWYLGDISLICVACPPTIKVGFRQKKEKIYSGVVLYPGAGELDPMLAKVRCPANQCDWVVVLMPMRI